MMFPKPSFKNAFGPEIRQNIVRRYGTQLSQASAVQEGKMYALDMCIEFQRKSDGLLSPDWIQHIASEVFNALNDYVFDISVMTREAFIREVETSINSSAVQDTVDSYYNRF